MSFITFRFINIVCGIGDLKSYLVIGPTHKYKEHFSLERLESIHSATDMVLGCKEANKVRCHQELFL